MKKTPHFPAIPLPHPLLMLEEHVAAGFPNPCEEFLSKSISLDELVAAYSHASRSPNTI
jgi:hypothetical protein